ncbi:MAG TPA: ComEC/Rec2 family competence protein, partial [Ohtaekwangia sp.]|nr:ComEC/Rec2 family competence protein [Ohtaekwangia sp.]
MFFWIPYAFIRIVVFFIAGILVGIYYPESIPLEYAVILFFSSVGAYFLIAYLSRFAKQKMINPGFAGLLAILLAGYLNVHLKTDADRDDHFARLSDQPGYYKAVVTGYATERNKTWRMEVRVTAVKQDSAWQVSTGMVMLYLSKADFTEPFEYGDVLLVNGSPQAVKPPSNPGEFDYQKFLSYKNIYHQHFLRKGNVARIGSVPDNPVTKLAIDARIWADSTLRKFVSGEREQAIASALVLGITDGLDNDLLNAYAATGAMHVLAVSGLHISIIYLIILTLFKPFNKSVSGRWTLAFISLLILWIYAFITGLSPSVLRAVTMFSFVALAKPWKQKVNIYNTLGASAFFLLLFDPYMIMSVGFQLSYLAVLGIVYIQPKMYLLWEPKHRLVDQIWKVTTVSIAAQIATLPLGLLYFHQFPNYFLLANLLVIPGSFIVLVGGLAILA